MAGANERGKARLAVLASGRGTLLDAFLKAGLQPCVVAVDRHCPALEVARRAQVPVEVVLREDFTPRFPREAYTHRLVNALADHEADAVAMAGFGTVLAPEMFAAFPNRVLNTHPSLLPAFKGWHAVREALAAGVPVTGTTVHIATEAVDSGPVLAQREVPVLPGDTEATLHERVKAVERKLYPEVVKSFLLGLERAGVRPPGGGPPTGAAR